MGLLLAEVITSWGPTRGAKLLSAGGLRCKVSSRVSLDPSRAIKHSQTSGQLVVVKQANKSNRVSRSTGNRNSYG